MKKYWLLTIPGALILATTPAAAIELKDAVQAALNTNPEIRQAVANRVATQEERVQAQGLWYPRISVEGSAGIRSLRNPTRRSIGLADQTLYPIEGQLIFDQLLFNRPVPGYAQYRSPIRDLWMCGASTHPGGGVMGAPGRNAAAEILRSIGKPSRMSDAYAVL